MSIVLIDKKVSDKEIKNASEEYGSYIKIVVDTKSGTMTIGGLWHVEGEKVLIENGSNQNDLWGGGIDIITKKVVYNSLINIRPEDDNDSMEILNTEIRKKFLGIVKNKFQI